jgi:predicted metalloprotease with PDZ domain
VRQAAGKIEIAGEHPRMMVQRSNAARVVFIGALATLALLTAGSASATIRYRVSLAHNEEHLFQVEMEIPRGNGTTVVAMPAWNALYQIRDFSSRIRNLEAVARTAANGPETHVGLSPIDKQTWRLAVASQQSETELVRYSIVWDDPGPFNSQLNAHHAFVNLAEILMYVPDRRREDTEIQFAGLPADWKLAAELPSGGEANSFKAESYDALVDAPVEAGKFTEFSFENENAHFRVVVDAPEVNKGRFEDFLRRITRYEIGLMQGAPFKEYTFFFHLGSYADVGGGGMEHSNSTAISANSIESAAGVAAHEFFHAWNVKRIRPQSLEPVDYSKEQFTRALWFAEGVTSTYGAYALMRSNLWTKGQFFDDLATQISELQSRPAHKFQSVEESSLDAWLEKYDTYNSPERSISYYNKGQLDGVMLDLAIRDATDNRKSLDDVMRALNVDYAKAGKFYDDSAAIRSVAEQIADKNFDDFFRRFVAGTDEIPYDDFLAAAGWKLKIDTMRSADLGFSPGTELSKGVTVSDVEPGSAAEAAGLRDGDVISPAKGGKSASRDFADFLHTRSAGDPLTLYVRRAGQEMEISFLVGTREESRYSIEEIPHASGKQRRIRDGILHGTNN